MEIRGATLAQLETAATLAQVRFSDGRWKQGARQPVPKALNARLDRWSLTLRTDPGHPMAGHPRAPPVWTRRAQGSGDLLGGKVCWHGHRAFMAALFTLAPAATLRSAFATYRGQADFEASHRATGHHNIGSQVRPVHAQDACTCGDTVATGPRGGLRLTPGFEGDGWTHRRRATPPPPRGTLRASSVEIATAPSGLEA